MTELRRRMSRTERARLAGQASGETRRLIRDERLDREAVKRIVERAPQLTPEQRQILAAVFQA